MTAVPTDLIERPDGSFVSLETLEPSKKLAHELVTELFQKAEKLAAELSDLKQLSLTEMQAYREMMMADYNVTVGGQEGNLSLRSVCGKMKVELSVAKFVSFGPELEAAKGLLDEFLNDELEGSSDVIREIVTGAFALNSKGRINRDGILGLQKHKFESPLWQRAMKAIQEATIRDATATYIRFYSVDPATKKDVLVALDLAKA